ncbi:MAG TPA: response regulator transcription factor [Gemmatimonadaceae bacterium]|jgi:DNA-binding response OmpR family regulator|nr:response regulator transcription factor [Gemmatimonadaceae bacterium]
MECIHPAIASVAILSNDAGLARRVAAILGDGATEVTHSALSPGEREVALPFRPDVVVIDRDSADDVGSRIRRMRRRWPTIDIIVVNARGEGETESLLDAGADDAIAVASPLLAARLHACTRRARTVNAGARIAVGDVVFDREARRVWCAGREVEMTPREQAILDCLFWYAPEPVGAQTLSDFVWGDEPVSSRRGLVEVYVGYVRRKLSASRAVVIRTVRGVGYQFSPRNAASAESPRDAARGSVARDASQTAPV